MKQNKLPAYWIGIFTAGMSQVNALHNEVYKLVLIGLLIVCSMFVYLGDRKQ